MKIDSKTIRKHVKDARGRGTAYSDLISVKDEYLHVKKIIDSLCSRKIKADVSNILRDSIADFTNNLGRIKVGAMVNKMAEFEVRYSQICDKIDEATKIKISKECEELSNHLQIVVATMDRFTGKCFRLMDVVNNEQSDFGQISVALENAKKLVGSCITVLSRKSIKEIFADIDYMLAGYETEQSDAVEDSASTDETVESEITVNDTESDSNSVVDGGSANCQSELQTAVQSIADTNFDDVGVTFVNPSDEDVERLKNAV